MLFFLHHNLNAMRHLTQNLALTPISGTLTFDNTFSNKMNQIKENFESIFYKKGQILFNEGNLARGLHYIESGIVKIYKYGSDGKEQILRIAKKGDIVGYKSLLSDTNYNVSASILEDARLTYIPKEDFLDLFKNDQEISSNVMRLLCNDLVNIESKMVSMAYKPVRGRLAETLLELDGMFHEHKEDQKSKKGSFIQLSREDLANLIGTAKETVIRLLSEFKTEKLIKTEGKKIAILDYQGLMRIDNLYH